MTVLRPLSFARLRSPWAPPAKWVRIGRTFVFIGFVGSLLMAGLRGLACGRGFRHLWGALETTQIAWVVFGTALWTALFVIPYVFTRYTDFRFKGYLLVTAVVACPIGFGAWWLLASVATTLL